MTGVADPFAGRPVLAVEASTDVASCAVRLPGGEVVGHALPAGRRHVEGLPGLAGETIAAAGIDAADLGGVLVGAGPGSYMGVRAAVAVANALSYVAGCPAAEISTLDSLGAEVADAGGVAMVVLAAGRGRFYVACYRQDGEVERVGEARVLEQDELAPSAAALDAGGRVVGSGLPEEGTALGAEPRHPTARGHLAALDVVPGWVVVRGVAEALPRYGL